LERDLYTSFAIRVIIPVATPILVTVLVYYMDLCLFVTLELLEMSLLFAVE
jgi:hypothetical protein